jgi:hypothetical protein
MVIKHNGTQDFPTVGTPLELHPTTIPLDQPKQLLDKYRHEIQELQDYMDMAHPKPVPPPEPLIGSVVHSGRKVDINLQTQ